MAALIGGTGTGQSLHHFICSSTWDPAPIRRALAEYLIRTEEPHTWVVRPLLIPKTGRYSAGVGRFCDSEGRLVNAQQAMGVWLVSSQGCFPVDWRLHLPAARHGGPDGSGPGAPADGAADACLEMLTDWKLPPRPTLLELQGWEPVPALRRLRAAGLHPLARIGGETELAVTDSSLIGHQGRVLPAQQIMRAAHALRRPVAGRTDPPRSSHCSELAAAVRVSPPGGSAKTASGSGTRFVLVGSGSGGRNWPDRLWLTALPPEHAMAAISRFSGPTHRVGRSLSEVGDRVGLRDYAGRSLSGWHRHITLASVAYAIAELSGGGGKRPPSSLPASSAPDEVPQFL